MNLDAILESIVDQKALEHYPLIECVEIECDMDFCKTAMREAVRQALELAANKGALHANNLFAEMASDNGRLIHPHLVAKEMTSVIKHVMEEIE